MTHRRNQKYKARRRRRVAVAYIRKAFPLDGHTFDKRGRPIPGWRWHQLLATDRYRIIGRTEVGPILVSTVWLGLNHSVFEGPPVIFETMLFRAETHRALDWQERYSTLEDAQLGHTAVVVRLGKLGPRAVEILLAERD